MRAQRVYLDTSVVGGCHDDEFAPWSRGLMDDFRSGIFHPVVSNANQGLKNHVAAGGLKEDAPTSF